MHKLILLSDTVLVKSKSGKPYVVSPEDQVLLSDVEGVLLAMSEHTNFAIISNQAGIHSGYKSESRVIAEMIYVFRLLPIIQTAYFCPNFVGDRAVCVEGSSHTYKARQHDYQSYRKPRAGMIQQAIDDFKVFKEDCIMIGNREEDEYAAQNAGVEYARSLSAYSLSLAS